jgi:uncharacterized protein (TIGR02246 family)
VDLTGLESWIDAYILAWATNDPQAIGELFAEDARYYTHPFREPWKGREEIVRKWLENPDAPGSWKATYGPVAVSGNTGVVRGETQYFKEDGSLRTEYANIYIIQFDDEGRATKFTEWFMERTPNPGRER